MLLYQRPYLSGPSIAWVGFYIVTPCGGITRLAYRCPKEGAYET
jgi:hypothetical protein